MTAEWARVAARARVASELAMRAGEPASARRWRESLIGLIRFGVFMAILAWGSFNVGVVWDSMLDVWKCRGIRE
jgi:hypothetical protein